MARPDRSGRARSLSRKFAMQALYQWQLTGQSYAELLNQYAQEEGFDGADREYFELLLKGATECQRVAGRRDRDAGRPARRATRPGRARRY